MVWVDNMVYSQSSMNSHKWSKLPSVDSGTCFISEMMELTMERLNSKAPSSLRIFAKNVTMARCLDGYLRQSCCRLSNIVILYSSCITASKFDIFPNIRSIVASLPVSSKVVTASVATCLFSSSMQLSSPALHNATALGFVTFESVRTAANLSAGLSEVSMPRKQAMERDRLFSPRFGRAHMVRAASYGSIPSGCDRLDSRKSKHSSASEDTSRTSPLFPWPLIASSSRNNFPQRRIRVTIARGLRMPCPPASPLNFCTSFAMPNRSWLFI
mmetsp:Transcript_5685/g.12391  ORF Transcript_5685/g.12391 Transcript_5685/m.12391 type:complete len:271 (+) Transcript_5685:983-1795(+)